VNIPYPKVCSAIHYVGKGSDLARRAGTSPAAGEAPEPPKKLGIIPALARTTHNHTHARMHPYAKYRLYTLTDITTDAEVKRGLCLTKTCPHMRAIMPRRAAGSPISEPRSVFLELLSEARDNITGDVVPHLEEQPSENEYSVPIWCVVHV